MVSIGRCNCCLGFTVVNGGLDRDLAWQQGLRALWRNSTMYYICTGMLKRLVSKLRFFFSLLFFFFSVLFFFFLELWRTRRRRQP